MRVIRPLCTVAAAGAVLALAACGGPQPISQLGPDALYERGMAEFEDGHWDAAIRAFERLTSRYPTHPRIEEIRFHLADAYFGEEEYVTAADEFVRFATDFGSGELADDARFKTCQAYQRLSPDIQLDQNYTRAAVDHCSALVQYYPDGEYAERAREAADEMRDKLARKVFIGGEFYFERQAYDSAIVYFEQVVANHAGTQVAPRALLRLVEVYQELGYVPEAEEARERLIRDYPDSAQAEQARDISLASGS